jgi:hypothetical protein
VARALLVVHPHGTRHRPPGLVMRGRLREADQIRRHHGRFPAVEVVHDEYTTDIAENQLLRTATERLLHLPGLPKGLLRLRVRLADDQSGWSTSPPTREKQGSPRCCLACPAIPAW